MLPVDERLRPFRSCEDADEMPRNGGEAIARVGLPWGSRAAMLRSRDVAGGTHVSAAGEANVH